MADHFEFAGDKEWDLDDGTSTWDEYYMYGTRTPPHESGDEQQVVASQGREQGEHYSPSRQQPGSHDQFYQHSRVPPIARAIRAQENISPRKWQTSGEPKKASRRLPPPRLTALDDNAAQAAWRAHAEPVDQIRIPVGLILPADKGQRRYRHEEIAHHHGTFILGKHEQGHGGNKTCGIWGEPGAVARTKDAIRKWVEDETSGRNSERSASFTKVVSLTPANMEKAEKRWAKEVTKQRYRQDPAPNARFGAVGSFHWPVDDCKPEEVLGGSSEALDPIRMDCSCYIGFNSMLGVFRVMGKASAVQLGLQRLRQTCFQISAKHVAPVRLYLLWWPQSFVPLYVYLQDYERPAITSPQDVKRAKPGYSPRGEDDMEDEERSKCAASDTKTNTERVRSLILNMLTKLHYYHGSIQMRIRFGTFIFRQFKAPKDDLYDLKEYESMTRESQFQADVTREFGDKPTEDALLASFQQTTGLIAPSDPTTSALAHVKPTYSATFTFSNKASGSVGELRLTVEWQEVSDNVDRRDATCEQTYTGWTRLDRDTDSPTPLLDVSLTNLNSGKAWQFDVVASQPVEEWRVPQQLQKFARNLSIDLAKAKSEEPFVRYNAYVPNLRSEQQRVTHRYTLVRSDFTLELSRFQNLVHNQRVDVAGSLLSAAPGGQAIIYEHRWSLQVYRPEWNNMFMQNERLSIGRAAGWSDDAATWFPDDANPDSTGDEGLGWEQLVDKLARIEAVVTRAQAEAYVDK